MNDGSNSALAPQQVEQQAPAFSEKRVVDNSRAPNGTQHKIEAILAFVRSAADEMHTIVDQTLLRRSIDATLADQLNGSSVTEMVVDTLRKSTLSGQMRLDLLNVPPSEAVRLVRPSAPLGVFWISCSGSLEWMLLTDYSGRKVRVIHSASAQSNWLTVKQFADRVAQTANMADNCQWLALQPMLMRDPTNHGHERHASPWSRLLALLAPERGDIIVIIIFAVLVGVLALSTPIAVESLVNTIAFGQLLQPVIVLAALLFTLLAFAASMRALQVYVAEIIQRRLFVRIAGELSIRLPRVRNEFWASHYGPELINRFFEVVTIQKVTTLLLLDGTALVLQTLVGMAVIAFYHPILLGFNLILLTSIAIVVFVLGRNAVATSIDESREKYATAAWLEELARHPVAFRSSGGMCLALDTADRLITSYLRARSTHFHILMRQMLAALSLQVLASTALLGLGGWLVIRGELTLGQLVAAELIVTVVIGSFAKIAKYLESYYDLLASMDKLGHLYDMPLNSSAGIRLVEQPIGIAVSTHDLTTSPVPSGQFIHSANIQVVPGDRVAVRGPNASLRRALLESIAGLHQPTSGHVELDGTDVRRLRLDSIQDQVAVVGEPEIFAGTIAQNLHLGRENVSDDDIRAALKAVGLLDVILDLPRGVDSPITTEGRLFTNDQLARLMLARAIAGHPRLLLIDTTLDCLPDSVIDQLLDDLRAALPKCTQMISTGRGQVVAACKQRLSIDINGNVAQSA